MRTWLITGCSSGLGAALVDVVLERGDRVVATVRDTASLRDLQQRHVERLLVVPLDLRDATACAHAVESGVRRFGRIDVLVNNAGYGYRAAIEEGDEAEVLDLFQTHVHGPVRLIKAVLPGMRAQRDGTIVNIASIAVQTTAPGSGYYAAAKAALTALGSSLRKEVTPLGIRVTTIEPGAFRTEFAGRSLQQSPTELADYAATAGRRRPQRDTSHGTQAGDPVRAARAIVEVVEADSVPSLLVLGSDAVDAVWSSLASTLNTVATWRELSNSTDHVEAEPSAT